MLWEFPGGTQKRHPTKCVGTDRPKGSRGKSNVEGHWMFRSYWRPGEVLGFYPRHQTRCWATFTQKRNRVLPAGAPSLWATVDRGAPRHLHVSFQTQSSSFFSEQHPAVPRTGRSAGQEGRPAIYASVVSKQNGFALAGFPGSSFFWWNGLPFGAMFNLLLGVLWPEC